VELTFLSATHESGLRFLMRGEKMEELKKELKSLLKVDNGRVTNFNKELDVVRIKHLYCDNGHLYGWSEYVTFQGKPLQESSKEVKKFKEWEKADNAKFFQICNEKGIARAIAEYKPVPINNL